MDADHAARLRALARHARAFEAPGFSFGAWEPSRTDGQGVIHLGWYRFSPAAEAFLTDVRAAGWVAPFDWQAWLRTPDGARLSGDPAAVAEASVADLQHLLTAIVRADRFSEGSLAGAFESGLLTAICRRAGELVGQSG